MNHRCTDKSAHGKEQPFLDTGKLAYFSKVPFQFKDPVASCRRLDRWEYHRMMNVYQDFFVVVTKILSGHILCIVTRTQLLICCAEAMKLVK